MQARKFRAVVHIGANEAQDDMTDESWIQYLNDTLATARVGVLLYVEPKARRARPDRSGRARRRR